MVPEAPLERTEQGLLPSSDGWFVLNAREAPWMNRERARGMVKQGKADFSQLGVGLVVLEPGEPMAMYHWETDQEDFLVSPARRWPSSRGRGAAVAAVGISCTALPGRST